jgi:NAD(P)-dependent dehydrogenase (short-subunit alcohol dehydrogenase family)
MDIAGKVFIVTGGASGLGEGTARMLAAMGGHVVIADMQADKGEAIAMELGGAFLKCDVSQEADAQAVVAKAVSMGKFMGLVNCAGIAPAVAVAPRFPCVILPCVCVAMASAARVASLLACIANWLRTGVGGHNHIHG